MASRALAAPAGSLSSTAARRLNWGCGRRTAPGWINADLRRAPGVDLVGDIRDGLPLPDASIDYAISMHGLQDLPYLAVVPALRELRRVLVPGGTLRLGLPDFERALDALRRGDRDYFYVPDEEARSLAGKLIVQLTWYGDSRMLFTAEFTAELLARAGFTAIREAAFGQTHSGIPAIVTLDNRKRESFFIEARAPLAETEP